jgi:hypothetical protein
MTEDNFFSGFMPMVSNVTIGQRTTMLNTEGDLVEAHSISIKVVEGTEYVFSITTENLMKLYFLIPKAL